MSKLQDQFDSPEDAYFGFFRADSAKDAVGWAAVMNYPHVRVAARAAGKLFYCDTAEEYAAGADWTAREATGWVLSRGREPIRAHESPNKVHLLGGWTRYNAEDEPILSNRVTYILTKPGRSWGIQARFSADTFTGQDTGEGAASAVGLAEQFATAKSDGDSAACASLCRYPFVQIGVGAVQRAANAAELRELLPTQSTKVSRMDAKAVQAGTHGVVVALTTVYESGDSEHAVMVLGRTEEAAPWRIAGVSAMFLPAE